jgi:acetyltransferase-like isoleucine patch superfamily enzyme
MTIQVNEIELAENVDISETANIICDKLKIGAGTRIAGNTTIQCKKCIIGKNNFIQSVFIEGSLNAGNTRIDIGDENLILQFTRLNCNDNLTIGDDVNIGQYVSIYTHASSMDALNGYPNTLSPVKIGSHVWITEGTIILPGVTIGSHVIIGNLSLVNKNLPDGCFAAGIPVKIISENIYPKKMTIDDKIKIINNAVTEYNIVLKLKHFSPEITVNNNLTIDFVIDGKKTIFDLIKKVVRGDINEYTEDFRDFLRYRGLKLFTTQPFKSIPPEWYTQATKEKGKKL